MALTTRPADRLVYFSDAVVAIAITLLVLPLVDLVPEATQRHETVPDLVVANLGPIGAFLLSFVVIARLWMSHHSLFDGVERVDLRIIWLDMLWLLTIVVLPFPTALTGSKGNEPLTAQLYVGVLAVNLVTLAGLALVMHRAGLGGEATTGDALRGAVVAAGLVVIGFVVLLFVPQTSFLVLLLLFLSSPIEAIWRRREQAR